MRRRQNQKEKREERGKGVGQNGINTMQSRFEEDANQFQCFLFKRDSLKVVQISDKI